MLKTNSLKKTILFATLAPILLCSICEATTIACNKDLFPQISTIELYKSKDLSIAANFPSNRTGDSNAPVGFYSIQWSQSGARPNVDMHIQLSYHAMIAVNKEETRLIASSDDGRSILLIDPRNGKNIELYKAGYYSASSISQLVISEDGTLVAFREGDWISVIKLPPPSSDSFEILNFSKQNTNNLKSTLDSKAQLTESNFKIEAPQLKWTSQQITPTLNKHFLELTGQLNDSAVETTLIVNTDIWRIIGISPKP